MPGPVAAQDLKAMLTDGEPLALVDVREIGIFSAGHLLFASSMPLSRLELMADDLIPCRGVRVVVVDDDDGRDDGLAAVGAKRLIGLGYTDVAVLQGGLGGWRDAGFEVFSGINVPSKAFGEFIEHTYDTPRMPADEVKAEIDAGTDMVILDSRPFDEYHRMNIPGGVDVPGAELVYRVHDLAPDPKTLVVVNCAGRTRSIIGAQSLINAGIPNRVVALKDGTMGWHLAGHGLDHGQTDIAPAPQDAGLAKGLAAAAAVAARFGVKTIDGVALASWRQEAAVYPLYLLDVRTPAEFESEHLPGSRNAPGGQLVQATDEYMAVRNARAVLIDDNGVRATMTASWLMQLGWRHVRVLAGGLTRGLDGVELETGPHVTVAVLGLTPGQTPGQTCEAATLQAELAEDAGTRVVDLADSVAHRAAHIPGAYWQVRARLAETLADIPGMERLVLSATDARLAHLAAADLGKTHPDLDVRVLDGGNGAWKAAGLPMEDGFDRALGAADDVWRKPYEQLEPTTTKEDAMREYLTWEVALVEQIKRDGSTDFRVF